MIRVGSIVIRVDDIAAQRLFWTAALGYTAPELEPGDDFVILRPASGDGPNVSLDAVHADRHLPPRIHLDLYADDQAAEITRLEGLGASRVEWSKRPPNADYVIMEDPEGNRFCVVDAG